MRCIIVGSSMAMPSLQLSYEDTWVYKLIKIYKDSEFVDKSRRSSSVRRLVSEGQNSLGYDLLEFYNPNFVILQIGITDASPRLLPRGKLYTKIINKLPFSKFIYNIVRKTKGRTISCADLTQEQFYDCLSKYAKRALDLGIDVYCIKIAHCGSKVIKVSPHMNEAIDLYNKMYDKLSCEFDNVQLITPFAGYDESKLDDILQSDHIHLTPKGCDIVLNNILSVIRFEDYIKK